MSLKIIIIYIAT